MESRGTPARGRSGRGKALRARGKKSFGRPATFGERLLLPEDKPHGGREGKEGEEGSEGEEQNDQARYARRQLVSNAHRYDEPEPETDENGEDIEEPEVDLSTFLQKQRLTENVEEVDDDIDHSLDDIYGQPSGRKQVKKGQVQSIPWTEDLATMAQEKSQADAVRELTSRFRAHEKSLKQTARTGDSNNVPPSLKSPMAPEAQADNRDKVISDQDFLDDLLG
ncbi:hypothetical protein FRB99_003311 [Tulasnella sp. 403]|nr:hypothetical protein FRB99_003311 [Tulasnella sp. 403]